MIEVIVFCFKRALFDVVDKNKRASSCDVKNVCSFVAALLKSDQILQQTTMLVVSAQSVTSSSRFLSDDDAHFPVFFLCVSIFACWRKYC